MVSSFSQTATSTSLARFSLLPSQPRVGSATNGDAQSSTWPDGAAAAMPHGPVQQLALHCGVAKKISTWHECRAAPASNERERLNVNSQEDNGTSKWPLAEAYVRPDGSTYSFQHSTIELHWLVQQDSPGHAISFASNAEGTLAFSNSN